MLSKQTLEWVRSSLAVRRIFIIVLALFVSSALTRYFFANSLPDSLLLLSGLLLGLTVVLLLFTDRHRPNLRTSVYLVLFSIAISASIIIGDKITIAEVTPILLKPEDALFFLAWLVLAFCVANFLLYNLAHITSRAISKLNISRNLWIKASMFLFFAWIPYFFAFFPGILSSDTSDQLSQALLDGQLNNHHPVLIAGFISLLANLGLLLSGNYYIAIALTTIGQMLLTACVLGYTVSWLATRFSNPLLYKMTATFFAIFPLIPLFAISVGKDTFFGLAILLLTTALYDLVSSKGNLFKSKAWLVYFSLVALFVIFTRNNGVYIVILTSLVLMGVYYKHWKQTIPAFVCIAFITILVQGPVFSTFKIRLSSSTESFGVLLQQVGRAVAQNGNLSDNDTKTLAPILPIEKWARYYSPSTPDRLKFCYTELDACMNNAYLDEHKTDFLKTWLSIGLKNPRSYIEAFLVQSSNYWHIGSSDDYGSFRSDEKKYTDGSSDLIESTVAIKVSSLIKKTTHLLRSSPVGLIMNQAFLIWVVLFSAALLTINKRYHLLIILISVVAIWLSLMAAGPAMSFRYSFGLFLTLPVLFAVIASYSKVSRKRL